jgi:hypothetical protein
MGETLARETIHADGNPFFADEYGINLTGSTSSFFAVLRS